MLRGIAAGATLALFSITPVAAGAAADVTREALYSGDFDAGLTRLEPMVARLDAEAWFGDGLIRFVQAVEGFSQDLYRYGLAAPETGPLGPALVVPVPGNAEPEPLDYPRVRAILERLAAGLDGAIAKLEDAGKFGDYTLMLDPLKIRIDVNGDGRAEETESIERVMQAAFGIARQVEPAMLPAPAEPAPSHDSKMDRSARRAEARPPLEGRPETLAADSTIGLDRADAYWLAGYAEVFAAQADFLLAHDFEDLVNVSFHRLFPRARLPMQQYADGGTLVIDPETDTAIADAVAAIHALNWDVVEPARLRHVLERFRHITQLSRQDWQAILAETDDNRELIPSPRQTSIVPEGRVTQEVVDAWLETLDVADKVLAGDLLVPHWRFRQGFDLKAYFETAKRTDIVMLLTGYDAIPYLRDGPVATAASFAAANRVFGDQFLGYVFWFN